MGTEGTRINQSLEEDLSIRSCILFLSVFRVVKRKPVCRLPFSEIRHPRRVRSIVHCWLESYEVEAEYQEHHDNIQFNIDYSADVNRG